MVSLAPASACLCFPYLVLWEAELIIKFDYYLFRDLFPVPVIFKNAGVRISGSRSDEQCICNGYDL